MGVGAVVPTGTAKPAIASGEDLKRALLGARIVIYANPEGGGAAGIHAAHVIERLGIAEQLKPNTQFGAGGDITEVTLAAGQGAFGLTQISEIVNKPGAEFVGPLPDGLQNFTVVAGGVPISASRSEATAALIAFLRSQRAAAALKANGMEVD